MSQKKKAYSLSKQPVKVTYLSFHLNPFPAVQTKSAYVLSLVRLILFADLLAEQKLIEETCGNLNKCTQTDEEELLEARLNETKSITEGG